MPPTPPLPPLVFPGSTRAERRWLQQRKERGELRAIGPRLYSSLPKKTDEATVRASWSTIVASLFPDALISHRTALEFAPSPDAEIILSSTTNRVVRYPGLSLRFVRGPRPLADDPKFLSLRSSSRPRAFLENLATVRPSARSRVLPIEDVERRLEQILHVEGEAALGVLRDRAREIATELAWRKPFERLDRLIGALLGTWAQRLASSVGRARAAGEPFDAPCLERLQLLFGVLRTEPLPTLVDPHAGPDHHRNKAFFEAYFSNYIEGTTFEIEEAERIVFDRQIPAARPEDAHDILGTFRIVSDPTEMRRTPGDLHALLDLLRARHATLMAQRPEAAPGQLKTTVNRAGDTTFVHPEYVVGTLRKGSELHADLSPGLARAIFMMFLITDVHPFVDGNGRIARIMMNAELHAAHRSTVIIPTVFRDDYLLALRALTRRHRPHPLVQAMVRAQAFSTRSFTPYPRTLAELTRRNWFREPEDAKLLDA